MNRRRIIIFVSIFIVLIIIAVSFFVKGEWKETMSTFGPLDIIGADNIEIVDGNRSSSSFLLTEKRDYYLSGSITVNKGNVSCIITCDGTKIYENKFNTGNYHIKTDIFNDKTGEIRIEILASDDVDGDYNIILYTRESAFNHIIRRLKEFF